MKTTILIFFILFSLSTLGQSKHLGTYSNSDEFTSLEFVDGNKFEFSVPSGPDCGNGYVRIGTYELSEKFLTLKFHYNYPDYQNDLKKQYFKIIESYETRNDSIEFELNIVDKSFEWDTQLSNANLSINDSIYKLDKYGSINLKLLKNEKYQIVSNIFDCPKVDTIITAKENLRTEIGLMMFMMDSSKEYKSTYEIIKHTFDELIIKDINNNGKVLSLSK